MFCWWGRNLVYNLQCASSFVYIVPCCTFNNDIFIYGCGYPLHPDHIKFPKGFLMWNMIYPFRSNFYFVIVFDSVGHLPYALRLTGSNLLPHMVSSSVFFLLFSLFNASKIKYINMGQPTPYRLYPHMTPQTHIFLIIKVCLIYNV